ncbi:hypothetical protein ANN_07894 [Periplaneta americana]|uniref:DUF4371 domain-containing protein n=1 Tax=Periplaneta americana TaxID=6978 RepID=A0ABQ8SZW7_PERAM|nr:hypothetical protein ANN_07894 [Periplaneta americana]
MEVPWFQNRSRSSSVIYGYHGSFMVSKQIEIIVCDLVVTMEVSMVSKQIEIIVCDLVVTMEVSYRDHRLRSSGYHGSFIVSKKIEIIVCDLVVTHGSFIVSKQIEIIVCDLMVTHGSFMVSKQVEIIVCDLVVTHGSFIVSKQIEVIVCHLVVPWFLSRSRSCSHQKKEYGCLNQTGSNGMKTSEMVTSGFEVRTYVIPLEDNTTREDLFQVLKGTIEQKRFNLQRLVSIATDETPAMTGKRSGLVGRINKWLNDQEVPVNVTYLLCLIHQEALWRILRFLLPRESTRASDGEGGRRKARLELRWHWGAVRGEERRGEERRGEERRGEERRGEERRGEGKLRGASRGANWLFNDAVSTTRLFSVDEIGDNEMVFGEMRPRIPLTVGENFRKKPNQFKVCHGSLYAVMWLADEIREFNLPTLPQRRITYVPEKLPGKYGVHSEEYLPIRTVLPVVAEM